MSSSPTVGTPSESSARDAQANATERPTGIINADDERITPEEIEAEAFIEVVPDARRIRRNMGLSQAQFAEQFGLNLRVLQEWEQLRAMPDQATRVLLRIIESRPDVVKQVVISEQNERSERQRRLRQDSEQDQSGS